MVCLFACHKAIRSLGDLERSEGLPVSPNCDRHLVDVRKSQVRLHCGTVTSAVLHHMLQAGFLEFLVLPLFKYVAQRLVHNCKVCMRDYRAVYVLSGPSLRIARACLVPRLNTIVENHLRCV